MVIPTEVALAIEKDAIKKAAVHIAKTVRKKAARYAKEAIAKYAGSKEFENIVKTKAIQVVKDDIYENCFETLSRGFMKKWTEKILNKAIK